MKKSNLGTIAVAGVLATALAVSVTVSVRQLEDYRRGENVYAQAQSAFAGGMARLEEFEKPAARTEKAAADENAPRNVADGEQVEDNEDALARALCNLDLEGLRQRSADAVGWLYIPGLGISYPLMQGRDNDFYLNHAFDGSRNAVGAIFMDYRNDAALGDFNTVIYGHRMNDGSMFAPLKTYLTQEGVDENPYVYIVTPAQTLCFEVFAAYEGSAVGESFTLDFDGEAARTDFLQSITAAAMTGRETELSPGGQILTLSTCTGRGHKDRLLVHGVLTACISRVQTEKEKPAPAEESTADAGFAIYRSNAA